VDIDECASVDCGGASTCINHVGKFVCECAPGMFTTGINRVCEDVDECVGITCGGDSTCTNGDNEYVCNCAAGWTSSGNSNELCTVLSACTMDSVTHLGFCHPTCTVLSACGNIVVV
jgi:Notch-like protein